MTRPDSEERLEKFIGRVLSEQPLRQAPADLSSRVLARIEQRAARAWWQMGFQEWPPLARILFLVASVGVGAFALEIPGWVLETINSQIPVSFSRGVAVWQAANNAASSVLGTVPTYWIYGALGAIAALYASFFAVGAAAYRTLYQNR
jgi:hypothetical protein